jgi:uncharacterized membrane protein/nitrite reductase/ring-hydroxylating ferredoxin subunit
MKSRANIKSHPIHPILVAFPIAFFIGTVIFDILSQIRENESFWNTGGYLTIAGIAGAILAAIAGIVDYVHTIPPESSAKKRATKHGLINTTVLIFFCVALYLRQKEDFNKTLIIGLEVLGVVLMTFAGWMGGTLVHRNQIGVDIRYADAGKWKELQVDNSSGEIEVADIDELKPNQMKLIHAPNKRIVLGRTEEGYVAFEDRCSHKGGSLAGGAMICGTVQCPWHGSQFNLKTGAIKAGPGKDSINIYPVFERGSKVFLMLP